MDTQSGIALWTAYNHRLLALVEAEDVPVISFDHSADTWRVRVADEIERLGLRVPDADSDFFDETLRHQSGSGDAQLPEDTARLYYALCARALA